MSAEIHVTEEQKEQCANVLEDLGVFYDQCVERDMRLVPLPVTTFGTLLAFARVGLDHTTPKPAPDARINEAFERATNP